MIDCTYATCMLLLVTHSYNGNQQICFPQVVKTACWGHNGRPFWGRRRERDKQKEKSSRRVLRRPASRCVSWQDGGNDGVWGRAGCFAERLVHAQTPTPHTVEIRLGMKTLDLGFIAARGVFCDRDGATDCLHFLSPSGTGRTLAHSLNPSRL